MARIDREILLAVPLETVYGHVLNPVNWLEFWPSLIGLEDVQTLPNGGYRANWECKMVGMRFEGDAEYTRVFPNQFFVVETRGGISSTLTWTFRAGEGITKLSLTIEYRIPIPLLGKLAEAIVRKMNEHEADSIIANLGARFMHSG